MKEPAKLLWLRLGASLLCFGACAACAQVLKPQNEATVSIVTNKLPDTSSRLSSPPLNSSESGKNNNAQPSEIVTRGGTIYKDVTVQKVDADGLTIGYSPAGGGIGAAKLKFEDLSDALQQRYKYNPDKAAAYEAQQAKGMAAWRAQQPADAESAKRVATQQAEQDALAQQEKTAQKEMTEQQKKEAQKGIESTWSGFTSSVKAGRITN